MELSIIQIHLSNVFQVCLPMGVIYYITIPSMYLFLTIYSVFNLNVVSWGTREVPKKKTADEMEQVGVVILWCPTS